MTMWPTELLAPFVVANMLTAICYYILCIIHLHRRNAEANRQLMHWLYAAFIGACGAGHLVMAIHMAVYPTPLGMTVSHTVTAVVSLWTVYEVLTHGDR